MTNDEMWELAMRKCSTLQIKEEILWAMERIQKHIGKPLRNFLEIGLHGGGSLCMWSQIVADDGRLYGITLHQSQPFMEKLIPALTGKKFSMINEASELPTTKVQLVKMLDGDKLDGVFVDSLHTAEQSKKEFNMYSPLLASPGVFAFHDVEPKPEGGSTGHYYQQMKFNYVYEEFRTNKHPNFGIGLLLL